MSDNVIVAFFSLAGVLMSGLISWLISRSTTAKEISQLKMAWCREDTISFDDEFARMIRIVSRYICKRTVKNYLEACEQVAYVCAKETGNLGYDLEAFYLKIKNPHYSMIELDNALTEIIEKKREAKRSEK